MKVLSYSEKEGAKIEITNPTTSPIYFEAPPRAQGSIEYLDDGKWVPNFGGWCGNDRFPVVVPAGKSLSYTIKMSQWLPHDHDKFRFHIQYVTEADYQRICTGKRDGVHIVSIYSEPNGG